MTISEFCIKRPVFATVLSLILMVIGVVGLHDLDTRFLPQFDSNHLTVSATYPGASAALVETSITTPLEDAISGVEGIDALSSTSAQNVSQIDVTLVDGVDVDEAANKIRTQLENARQNLPSDVLPPQVQIRNPGSSELMDIGVVNPTMSLAAVRDFLERSVINEIKQIPGVSMVNVTGANTYVMRVNLDPKKMLARQVTLNDVKQAIQNNNVELPAGKIHGAQFDYPVTASTKMNTAQAFNDLVIQQGGSRIIHLRDVGQAKITTDPSSDSVVRINGQPGIILSVNTTDNANPINTSRDVQKFLTKINSQLPSGMKIITAYDQANFMKDSIHEVYVAIIFSIVCVLAVIYLFLGQIRSVLVPIITIPICLYATFGVMYFMGFTINIITLLGIVLSIGLVVDDAIVMLENVHRHIEDGDTPMAAAMKGSQEIGFAIIAMTLTLAAVYAPVGFIHGKIASIFKPFAFTLAGAVIISGFVALTLSPMMCARLLKPKGAHSKYLVFLEHFFGKLASRYQHLLSLILNKRYLVMTVMGLIVVGGFFLFRSIPFGFLPDEDMGLVLAQSKVPSGANIHAIADSTEAAAKVLGRHREVQSVVSIADTSQQSYSLGFATLKPFSQRKSSAQQVASFANATMATIPGLDAFVFPVSFGGSMKHQLEFIITADKSYKDLYGVSKKLVDQLAHYPGLRNTEADLSFDSQQYVVTMNRAAAAQLKVSANAIDTVISTMLGGMKVSTMDVDGQSYDVYMMGYPRYQKNLESLNSFYVSSSDGKMIPLSNLVEAKSTLAQTTLSHYNRQRAATISAQLGDGYSLGTVVAYLNNQLPTLLPADVHYAFQGMAKNVADSNSSMGLIFVLALAFIYLVLSAQFESFMDPLIILLAVPFSVIGALLSLKLINGSINVYTIVGLVTLIGLVAKHGILITQFANEQRQAGVELRQALLQAATIRLRPILMTTAAMIFGAVPLIFSFGASAVSRQQIGAVIVSGLFFGTFFSLILVPVMYTYIDKIRQVFTMAWNRVN